MRMFTGCIKRTPLPVGPLLILVSTRLAWRQRTMHALFSDELDTHLRNLGAAERARIGLDRGFTVEARSESVDSWARYTWEPRSHTPAYSESEDTDPPYERHE